uniref:Uncharacterized protein n=1 Tax=Romanomermis culicivorax TaxID=13658 RepID=A0A915IR09_ROMCU
MSQKLFIAKIVTRSESFRTLDAYIAHTASGRAVADPKSSDCLKSIYGKRQETSADAQVKLILNFVEIHALLRPAEKEVLLCCQLKSVTDYSGLTVQCQVQNAADSKLPLNISLEKESESTAVVDLTSSDKEEEGEQRERFVTGFVSSGYARRLAQTGVKVIAAFYYGI